MGFNRFLIRYLCCYYVEYDNVTLFILFYFFGCTTAKKNLNSHTVCLSRFSDPVGISTISSDVLSGKAGLCCPLKSAVQAFLYA